MNMINWFEIPAGDFDRAVRFYSTVLGEEVRAGEFGGLPHGFLPGEDGVVTGAIVKGNGDPSGSGVLLYLNARTEENLDAILSRVESAGGKVRVPKTAVPPQGHMAEVTDSEGNRVAFHAPPAA